MCGISGLLHFNPLKTVNSDIIKKMCSQIVHRGPDEEGFFFGQNVGLGMRRLSIIDIKSGQQPVSNENHTVHVVFNGEIYNFIELRKILEGKGHTFKSNCDTETIVHLYEEHGEDCVKHLRGMFAIALWDQKKRCLLLARDHIGKKPLFYRKHPESISFGSEIRQLLFDGSEKPNLNYQAIYHYLSFQYIPTPISIYKNVYKLPAGHLLTCSEQGDIDIKKFWGLDYSNKTSISFNQAKDQLESLLNEATKDRMVSEVPLGAFLSGGIDSSLITSFMQRNSSTPIKTFTVGFDNEMFDETHKAQVVAEHLGTDHTTLHLNPDFMDTLPKIIGHFGEPFADPSAIPTYFLCQEAKKHITVALCGDGGDENFAGYSRYAINAISMLAEKLPAFLTQRLIRGFFNLLPDKGIDRSRITAAKHFVDSLNLKQPLRNIESTFFFSDEQKYELFREEFLDNLEEKETMQLALHWFDSIKAKNFLDQSLGYDIEHYLIDNILVKADISSMAHSLELRSPLLDFRVLELVSKFPSNWKLNGLRRTKYVLKKIAESHLPKEIITMRKQGFTPPIAEWFRGKYKEYLKEVLLDSKSINRGYFNKSSVEKLIKEHIDKKFDHSKRLWALLILEHWHRVYWDPSIHSLE